MEAFKSAHVIVQKITVSDARSCRVDAEWANVLSTAPGASGCIGAIAQFLAVWEVALANVHVTRQCPLLVECCATEWSDKWTCVQAETVRLMATGRNGQIGRFARILAAADSGESRELVLRRRRLMEDNSVQVMQICPSDATRGHARSMEIGDAGQNGRAVLLAAEEASKSEEELAQIHSRREMDLNALEWTRSGRTVKMSVKLER